MYQILTTPMGNAIIVLEKDGIRLSFEPKEDNTDYQTYLAWVAEGNVAEEWNPNGN
jgi:hypothetical protein